MKAINFNNMFSHGLCLIGGQLAKYDNTINNYDSSYKITDNNTIKIILKNYYEKMSFIVKAEGAFICIYSIDNNFLNCCKFI